MSFAGGLPARPQVTHEMAQPPCMDDPQLLDPGAAVGVELGSAFRGHVRLQSRSSLSMPRRQAMATRLPPLTVNTPALRAQ